MAAKTPPPTLRTLARQAGVTPMTVSLALRNHPSISETTRKRIHQLAEKAGYRPDPEVARLMQHLRTRRATRYQATLCGLRIKLKALSGQHGHGDEVSAGAKRRAAELGFGYEEFLLEDLAQESRSAHRVLRNRGVEGLLLLPMGRPVSLQDFVQWKEFSVVTATLSVLNPHFHGVIPDQFGNMMKLCGHLAEKGFRRAGLVTLASNDRGVGHRFTGALAWHRLFRGMDWVKPFIHPEWPPDAAALQRWFQAMKPEVLIVDSAGRAEHLRKVLPLGKPGAPPVYCAGLLSDGEPYPGINEHPQEIGAVAVELLSGQLQRGLKGIPPVPHLTIVEGSLRE